MVLHLAAGAFAVPAPGAHGFAFQLEPEPEAGRQDRQAVYGCRVACGRLRGPSGRLRRPKWRHLGRVGRHGKNSGALNDLPPAFLLPRPGQRPAPNDRSLFSLPWADRRAAPTINSETDPRGPRRGCGGRGTCRGAGRTRGRGRARGRAGRAGDRRGTRTGAGVRFRAGRGSSRSSR